MSLEPGQMLSHYRLIDKIGEGGMGVVYSAEDTKLDRKVALKVLPQDLADNPDRRMRFEREAKAVATLNHPHIVTLHSVEEQDGLHFITMELVEGKPLSRMLPRGGAPMDRIFDLMLPLIDAVSVAHEHGITHRDLKPDNVMVRDDGRIKILDFGLAKMLEAPGGADPRATHLPTATATDEGRILGTVAYMSPEQTQGKAVDHRTDIFALGVMLFEMASGQRPFSGDTGISIISSIIKDTPPVVTDLNRTLPRHFGRIIRRCLEKDPERRYQRARDLLTELEDLKREVTSDGAPIETSTAGALPPEKKRSVFPWLAAAAVIVTLGTLGVFRLAGRGDAGNATATPAMPEIRTASVAVLPFLNSSSDPDNEYFSDGITDELINALVRVEGLNVPARRSVFRFKGDELPVTEIGRQLGVANVLEGNVRKDGDRLKITAQLVGVEDGFNRWSNTYEVQVEDVFAVQEEIANAIVSSLEVRLIGPGGGKLVGEHTSNLEAYNLYLRGQFHLNKRVESHLLKAGEFYEEAIRLDPDYALAHVGLGWSHFHLSSWYRPPHEEMPQAKAAAHAALKLDDALATAHVLLGYVNLNYDWDWDAARQRVRRALELNPNSAEAHLLHALILTSQGEAEEGVREAQRAEELDPMALGLKWDIWIALYFAREYEAAFQVCDRALQLDPEFAMSLGARGFTLMQMGHYERAILDLERAVALDEDNITNLEFLLYTYAMSGDKDRARAGLEGMVRRARERYTCPYEVATVFVGIEEYDVAIQWFEEGYEQRADCWVWGKVDPRMDVMRQDERYVDLLRRVGHVLD